MIQKVNILGKLIVTATQMLESMIKSLRPTRVEAIDIINAVLDGTDCVMLSGETAIVAYPEIAIQTMARICLEAEDFINYRDLFGIIMETAPMPMSPLESLASLVVRTISSIKAAMILVLTKKGFIAKLVSKYRPSVPVLATIILEITTNSLEWSCSEEFLTRHYLVYKGLVPVLSSRSAKASYSELREETTRFTIQHAKEKGLCKAGNSIVALHPGAIKIMTVD